VGEENGYLLGSPFGLFARLTLYPLFIYIFTLSWGSDIHLVGAASPFDELSELAREAEEAGTKDLVCTFLASVAVTHGGEVLCEDLVISHFFLPFFVSFYV
jgi:hypothetical protein